MYAEPVSAAIVSDVPPMCFDEDYYIVHVSCLTRVAPRQEFLQETRRKTPGVPTQDPYVMLWPEGALPRAGAARRPGQCSCSGDRTVSHGVKICTCVPLSSVPGAFLNGCGGSRGMSA